MPYIVSIFWGRFFYLGQEELKSGLILSEYLFINRKTDKKIRSKLNNFNLKSNRIIIWLILLIALIHERIVPGKLITRILNGNAKFFYISIAFEEIYMYHYR